jgi:hypothetical protein
LKADANITPTEAPAPRQPSITGERLPFGPGLIHLPDFGGDGHDLVAEFDVALDAPLGAPGAILDLGQLSNGQGRCRLCVQLGVQGLASPRQTC